jgi:hypothetical protein
MLVSIMQGYIFLHPRTKRLTESMEMITYVNGRNSLGAMFGVGLDFK